MENFSPHACERTHDDVQELTELKELKELKELGELEELKEPKESDPGKKLIRKLAEEKRTF